MEEKKQKARESAKKYYYANKKKILEKQKIYKRKKYQNMSPEEKQIFLGKRKIIMTKYRNKNRERFREYQRKYKFRKRELGEAPKTKNMIIDELQERCNKLQQAADNWNKLKHSLEVKIQAYEEREKQGEGYELTKTMQVELWSLKNILSMMREIDKNN